MSPRSMWWHGRPGAGTWELSAQSASKRELPGKGGSLGLDHANVLCADHLLSNLEQKFGLYLAERLCNQAPVKAWGAEALTGDGDGRPGREQCPRAAALSAPREPTGRGELQGTRKALPHTLPASLPHDLAVCRYCTTGVHLRWACHHRVARRSLE